MFWLDLSDAEMEFLRQLVQSKIGVTMDNVEVVAAFKAKVLTAMPATVGPQSLDDYLKKDEKV